MFQVELTKFRVKKGQEGRAREWMQFLRNNMSAVEETLIPEKMYVETIFSHVVDGRMYLYWYSVQGENPQSVKDSDHWLDREHLKFWREVIDEDFPAEDLSVEAFMMMPEVRRGIQQQ